MSFYDEFKTNVEKGLDQTLSNVTNFLISETLSSPVLVKAATPPSGNLTAAQIQNGARGNMDPISSPTVSKSEISRAEGDGMGGYGSVLGLPLATIAGVAFLFYLFKKA